MKYYTFYRESNNFTDILTDANIKRSVKTKMSWLNHLLLGFSEEKNNENIFGYVVLKYGEDITNLVEKDYTPMPNIDYIPKR